MIRKLKGWQIGLLIGFVLFDVALIAGGVWFVKRGPCGQDNVAAGVKYLDGVVYPAQKAISQFNYGKTYSSDSNQLNELRRVVEYSPATDLPACLEAAHADAVLLLKVLSNAYTADQYRTLDGTISAKQILDTSPAIMAAYAAETDRVTHCAPLCD